MGDVKALFEIDFVSFLISLFIIISAIVTIATLITKFTQVIGKPLGWIKKPDKNKEEIDKMKKRLDHLESAVDTANEMLLDMHIDDYRWKILDFASGLSRGHKYNQEAFNHIFRIYEKYEKILKENGLENGLVDESMAYIRHRYGEILQQGVANYAQNK